MHPICNTAQNKIHHAYTPWNLIACFPEKSGLNTFFSLSNMQVQRYCSQHAYNIAFVLSRNNR